jgi:hypothetical protein
MRETPTGRGLAVTALITKNPAPCLTWNPRGLKWGVEASGSNCPTSTLRNAPAVPEGGLAA